MTREELEQIKKNEWEEFCSRYPFITSKTFISRLLLVFSKKHGDLPYMLWENGFLNGWLTAVKQEKDNAADIITT